MDNEIPIIDLTDLISGKDAAGVAAAIGAACRGVGFFYVTGHGIPDEVTRRFFAESRRFFAATPEIKNAASITQSPHNRGYVGMGEEILDPDMPADLKEAFNIGLELPADDPELAYGRRPVSRREPLARPAGLARQHARLLRPVLGIWA